MGARALTRTLSVDKRRGSAANIGHRRSARARGEMRRGGDFGAGCNGLEAAERLEKRATRRSSDNLPLSKKLADRAVVCRAMRVIGRRTRVIVVSHDLVAQLVLHTRCGVKARTTQHDRRMHGGNQGDQNSSQGVRHKARA